MIQRTLQGQAIELAARHPVVTLTGPRQSGKTTLARLAFPSKSYISLEPPAEREFAINDPKGFLSRLLDGAIIDEVQRAPDILSYIQQIVDERPKAGSFIVTGSQNFGLIEGLSQTLAGRTALLQLLPLSFDEIRLFSNTPQSLWELIVSGGYPRIYDRHLPPAEWLGDYVTTYIERDVRQILNVGDLLAFQTFLRLAAGRSGQLLNLSALGSEAGVTHATARAWISVLEAGYVAFRLPPFFRNIGKRLVKTPKLYFYDTGLLCYLLGIRNADQLETHPLRGSIFECWVVSEILKHCVHRGVKPSMFFYRDRAGAEVDLLMEVGRRWIAVEIKASSTGSSDQFSALARLSAQFRPFSAKARPEIAAVVVYAGSESQKRTAGDLLAWQDIQTFTWT